MSEYFQTDHLEPRRLMAAELNGGTLSINGTSAAETIVITNDITAGEVEVQFGTDPADVFTAGDVERIRVFADAGNDQVQFLEAFSVPITVYGGAGDDRVDAGSLTQLRAYGEAGMDVLRITGSSRDTLYGGDDNDTIGSNGGRDYLSGDGGDDNLNGGGLNDRLFGGDGADQLNGGNSDPGGAEAKDYISGGAGNDNINGGIGNDTILGDGGNDNIVGGTDRDDIDGGAGNDTINGESGNDSIYGGAGAGVDRLTGSTDRDRFYTPDRDAGEVLDFDADDDSVSATLPLNTGG